METETPNSTIGSRWLVFVVETDHTRHTNGTRDIKTPHLLTCYPEAGDTIVAVFEARRYYRAEGGEVWLEGASIRAPGKVTTEYEEDAIDAFVSEMLNHQPEWKHIPVYYVPPAEGERAIHRRWLRDGQSCFVERTNE